MYQSMGDPEAFAEVVKADTKNFVIPFLFYSFYFKRGFNELSHDTSLQTEQFQGLRFEIFLRYFQRSIE